MAKKKLGLLIFDILYNLGQDTEWQTILRKDVTGLISQTSQGPDQEEYVEM